jgi:hypothetical protein
VKFDGMGKKEVIDWIGTLLCPLYMKYLAGALVLLAQSATSNEKRQHSSESFLH